MDPQDLKAWRTAHKLTQDQAATVFDVGKRTWGAYEGGEQEIPRSVEFGCAFLAEHPEKIAEALAGRFTFQYAPGTAAPTPPGLLRLGVDDGLIAGTVELSMAGVLLAQKTLERLLAAGVFDEHTVNQVFNDAIDTQTNTPAPAPWRPATVNMLELLRRDVLKTRRAA